jgi:hypothetical protein
MGNGWAYVRFTAPTGAGSSTIIDYTITASDGTTQVALITASQPIKVTGLENGVSYTFAVKARNSVGYGSESSSSNEVTPINTSCALGGGCGIGDIGPGGGFVFYIAPVLFTSGPQCSSICEYLEVARSNWAVSESFQRWNGVDTTVRAYANTIGSGYQNSMTADLSAGKSLTSNEYLSGISTARRYAGGGKSDWYVPTIIEFAQIYAKRAEISSGGFGLSDAVYKSSLETSSQAGKYNYYHPLTSNTNTGASKTSTSLVRPIRAFKSG